MPSCQAAVPARTAPAAASASKSAGAASLAMASTRRCAPRRMQRTPEADTAWRMSSGGSVAPAACAIAAACGPARPISAVSALVSASLTLLRSTYIENFFRKAGRMSAESASAWPPSSVHTRKLAIMRPLGELKLFQAAVSASMCLTSFDTRLCRKAAESGPCERIVPRCSSGTAMVAVSVARASSAGAAKAMERAVSSSVAPTRARCSVQAVMVSVRAISEGIRRRAAGGGGRVLRYYRRPPRGGRPSRRQGFSPPVPFR